MGKIAVCHPGKIGDALYALPVAKKLAEILDCTVDFYTSEYCAPIENLVRYQPYINDFIIPPEYKVERMDMGVQPWYIPVDYSQYDKVFQLGFKVCPNKQLDLFMGEVVGITPDPITLEVPVRGITTPYFVVAPRGETTFKSTFTDFITHSPLPVYVIGGKGDYIGVGIDFTGEDFLDTAALIKYSSGFVGLMSSQLVLANAFPIPKVAVHDGKSWDMRHVYRTGYNMYPTNPTYQEVLNLVKPLSYSKTLDVADYLKFNEHAHFTNIETMLRGVMFRMEHVHRKWEYGLILNALRSKNTTTVLDIGGGGSLFAPALAWLGMQVTQVDPGNVGDWIKKQEKIVNKNLPFFQQDFFDFTDSPPVDAVVSLSVIEHVPDDIAFFKRLATFVKPGGLLAITTDFHPDGEQKSPGHIRTYNEASLLALAELLPDFHFYGFTDYSSFYPLVYNYSFASLVLERNL